MPWPPPSVRSGQSQRGIVARHRLVDETNAPLIQEFAVLVLGVDDHEAGFVIREMTLDQRHACLCRSSRSRSSQWVHPLDHDRPLAICTASVIHSKERNSARFASQRIYRNLRCLSLQRCYVFHRRFIPQRSFLRAILPKGVDEAISRLELSERQCDALRDRSQKTHIRVHFPQRGVQRAGTPL